jgi:hypothetical protein
MKNKKYESRLLKSVHETEKDLHEQGLIDRRKMHEYDFLCMEKWRHRPGKEGDVPHFSTPRPNLTRPKKIGRCP